MNSFLNIQEQTNALNEQITNKYNEKVNMMENKKREREEVEVPLGIDLIQMGLGSGRLSTLGQHIIHQTLGKNGLGLTTKDNISSIASGFKDNGFMGLMEKPKTSTEAGLQKIRDIWGDDEADDMIKKVRSTYKTPAEAVKGLHKKLMDHLSSKYEGLKKKITSRKLSKNAIEDTPDEAMEFGGPFDEGGAFDSDVFGIKQFINPRQSRLYGLDKNEDGSSKFPALEDIDIQGRPDVDFLRVENETGSLRDTINKFAGKVKQRFSKPLDRSNALKDSENRIYDDFDELQSFRDEPIPAETMLSKLKSSIGGLGSKISDGISSMRTNRAIDSGIINQMDGEGPVAVSRIQRMVSGFKAMAQRAQSLPQEALENTITQNVANVEAHNLDIEGMNAAIEARAYTPIKPPSILEEPEMLIN